MADACCSWRSSPPRRRCCRSGGRGARARLGRAVRVRRATRRSCRACAPGARGEGGQGHDARSSCSRWRGFVQVPRTRWCAGGHGGARDEIDLERAQKELETEGKQLAARRSSPEYEHSRAHVERPACGSRWRSGAGNPRRSLDFHRPGAATRRPGLRPARTAPRAPGASALPLQRSHARHQAAFRPVSTFAGQAQTPGVPSARFIPSFPEATRTTGAFPALARRCTGMALRIASTAAALAARASTPRAVAAWPPLTRVQRRRACWRGCA